MKQRLMKQGEDSFYEHKNNLLKKTKTPNMSPIFNEYNRLNFIRKNNSNKIETIEDIGEGNSDLNSSYHRKKKLSQLLDFNKNDSNKDH